MINSKGSDDCEGEKLGHDNEKEVKGPSFEDLFAALNFNRHQEKDKKKFDGNAVMKELRRNPKAAEHKFTFRFNRYHHITTYPLHQAIALGASIDVVKSLHNSYPAAMKIKERGENTALHLSCQCNTSLDVLSYLVEKLPDAVKMKNSRGDTPLHCACKENPSTELAMWLLNEYPDVAKEQNNDGETPIHHTFLRGEYLNVDLKLVSSFIEKCPPAVKVKNNEGWTTIHHASAAACVFDAPLEAVVLLLEEWPDALKMTTSEKETPLHIACRMSGFEVVAFLLEKWPDVITETDMEGQTPLLLAEGYAEQEVEDLVSCTDQIYRDGFNITNAIQIIQTFQQMKWIGGIVIMFNKHPSISRKIGFDNKVIPSFLSFVGYRCKMTSMWEIIRNRQDLLADIS